MVPVGKSQVLEEPLLHNRHDSANHLCSTGTPMYMAHFTCILHFLQALLVIVWKYSKVSSQMAHCSLKPVLDVDSGYHLENVIAQSCVHTLHKSRALVFLTDLHDNVRSNALVCILAQPVLAGADEDISVIH